MKRTFDKNKPTVVYYEGNHFLINEHGKIQGQIKSVVTDHAMESPVAEITFDINLCSTYEEAMEKYKEL